MPATSPPELNGQVVIAGAGHAGGSVAALLRQYGWRGPIVLVGDEPRAPYQRPPLSKAWLKGEVDAEALALRPDGFYADNDVDLRLGDRIESVDRLSRTVRLAEGKAIAYDRLIIATGARPRKLNMPGFDLEGVLELRDCDDAEQLRQALAPGKRLAVIGGGYIGLECAASARALGAEVVLVEREERLLARVACAALSEFFLDVHRRRGVEFALGAQIVAIDGANGKVVGLRFANGDAVPCDYLLVGVGAVPNDQLAREAGLECTDGVVVDVRARTSDPDIYAIGDCTCRPLPLYGMAMRRLESVPNALEQAKQAAADLTGRDPPADEVPWFWSDQYDLKLQIAGLSIGAEQTVVRGASAVGSFAVFHLDAGGRVQAVEAVNAPAEFMGGKQLIASRKPVTAARLQDLSVPMKAVAEA